MITLTLFLFPRPAQAKSVIVTLAKGVVVYSGPGIFYRPLAVLPANSELRASSKIVNTKDGRFYRVLVNLSEKKKVVGYIPQNPAVRYFKESLDEEDLEKFGDVALIHHAVQASFSMFRDQHQLWTLGYMNYLKPGFYVKGFAGHYSTAAHNAFTAGGEVGNDALLIGPVSGLVSYAAGVFAPNEAGTIFEASSSVNAMVQAAVGARYNIRGVAAVSAAATQAVFFNANNSFVTFGLNLTLEVGL